MNECPILPKYLVILFYESYYGLYHSQVLQSTKIKNNESYRHECRWFLLRKECELLNQDVHYWIQNIGFTGMGCPFTRFIDAVILSMTRVFTRPTSNSSFRVQWDSGTPPNLSLTRVTLQYLLRKFTQTDLFNFI